MVRVTSELPTGVTLVCRADSLAEARQIMGTCMKTTDAQ